VTSDHRRGDKDEGQSAPPTAQKSGAQTISSAPTELDPRLRRSISTSAKIDEVVAGRFRILEKLGEGGEGAVFGAYDLRADAVVAIKLLRRDSGRVERFRRELQMARRVTHPNVVRIYDLVDLPDRFALSMEYVRGETLERRLARKGPLSVAELRALASDLAQALAAAHAADVTHRDLKPSNVILRHGSGRAVITDFGIARSSDAEPVLLPGKAVAGSHRVTTVGTILGTPLYMAPEQFEGGEEVGPPTDVYAFGLVVREAAVGKPVHGEARVPHELLLARKKAPPPILDERPDLPPELARVLDRCLSPLPSHRYRGGDELLRALDAIPEGARLPTQPPRSRRDVAPMRAAERRTLHHRFVGDVMLCVHANEPPSPEDWQAFVDARDARAETLKGLLVVAPPKATIDVRQRENVRKFLKLTGTRLAVITESRVVRGLVTAVGWFTSQVRAFAMDEVEEGLTFLGLGHERHEEARKALRELDFDLRVSGHWKK
jgi:serine/threonine protein kinase